jgi:hypothetical protein
MFAWKKASAIHVPNSSFGRFIATAVSYCSARILPKQAAMCAVLCPLERYIPPQFGQGRLSLVNAPVAVREARLLLTVVIAIIQSTCVNIYRASPTPALPI